MLQINDVIRARKHVWNEIRIDHWMKREYHSFYWLEHEVRFPLNIVSSYCHGLYQRDLSRAFK